MRKLNCLWKKVQSNSELKSLKNIFLAWKNTVIFEKQYKLNKMSTLNPSKRHRVLRVYFEKYQRIFKSSLKLRSLEYALNKLSEFEYRMNTNAFMVKLKKCVKSELYRENDQLLSKTFHAWRLFTEKKKHLDQFMGEKSDSELFTGHSFSKISVKDHILSIIAPK